MGTNRIVDAIIENQLTSIVGGGDTVAAIRNYDNSLIEQFSHVSTGGGSCLEMLSGKTLPALEMLKKWIKKYLLQIGKCILIAMNPENSC